MNAIVVLPTYNERENLATLVRDVLGYPGFRLIVVDDRSPDGTGDIADALAAEFPGRVEVIHRSGPRGLGRSLLDGLSRALASDADLIFQMDADLSHDARYLPDLAAKAAQTDLVIGSRYLHGISVVNWPLSRLILSTFANQYVRLITGLPVRDCTSGYRCWRRDALARVRMDGIASEGYSFLVELLYRAWRAGCSVAESPIIFVERRHGQSKMSKRVILEAMITPWRLRMWR
jgi:dolichol-phosphate mannosyltransferase